MSKLVYPTETFLLVLVFFSTKLRVYRTTIINVVLKISLYPSRVVRNFDFSPKLAREFCNFYCFSDFLLLIFVTPLIFFI